MASKKEIKFRDDLESCLVRLIPYYLDMGYDREKVFRYICPRHTLQQLDPSDDYSKEDIEYYSDFMSQFYLAIYKRVLEIDDTVDVSCFFSSHPVWRRYTDARIIYEDYLKELKERCYYKNI